MIQDLDSDSGEREQINLSDSFESDTSDIEDITPTTSKSKKLIKTSKKDQSKKKTTKLRPRVEIEYETEDVPRERLRK